MTASIRKRGVIAGVCFTAVLAAGVGTWAVVDGTAPKAEASSEQRATHTTTTVSKGDLTDTKTFAGSLGYGKPVGVPGAASGTITSLPTPGQVIHLDEALYAADEHPVRAMHGTTPYWRELTKGLEGDDVHQLNENLAALGYDVSVDDTFGKRTLAAVQRYQKDRGMTVTGTLTANDIAFVDGDVRVDGVSGVPGQPAGGDVLTVTSTKRVVQASVAQREAERLAVGTDVRVRINGSGEPMAGSVVGSVPGESKDGGATVDVTIAFDAGDRQLPSAASAQIEAQGQTEQGVLSVPVSALVAGRTDGRYSVDVVRKDGAVDRVRVDAGFVAAGRVAVTGDVAEGDEVVVPS